MRAFTDWPPAAKGVFVAGVLTCGLPFICVWLPALWFIRANNANQRSPEMLDESSDSWTA